ncbi:MAG: hypothetical protein ACLUQ6_04380 [Alistipes onderdonkii]
MEDYGIWVEQTATDRTGFYRLTFTRDAEAGILLNLGGYLASTTIRNARVRRVGEHEIEGSFDTYRPPLGRPRERQGLLRRPFRPAVRPARRMGRHTPLFRNRLARRLLRNHQAPPARSTELPGLPHIGRRGILRRPYGRLHPCPHGRIVRQYGKCTGEPHA